MIKTIGFWAAIMLPLWDIPLIIQVIKRKSSQDISIMWAAGLWATAILMTPAAFVSHNIIAIGFNIANVTMLSAVLFVVVKYRKGHA